MRKMICCWNANAKIVGIFIVGSAHIYVNTLFRQNIKKKKKNEVERKKLWSGDSSVQFVCLFVLRHKV